MATEDHIAKLRELCEQAQRLREAADALCHQLDHQMKSTWSPCTLGYKDRRLGERRRGDRRG